MRAAAPEVRLSSGMVFANPVHGSTGATRSGGAADGGGAAAPVAAGVGGTGAGVPIAAVAVAAWLGVAGCVPLASTMRPAEVLPEGDVHVGFGFDAVVPVTGILDAVDTAAKYAERVDGGEELTEEEQIEVATAVIGLTATPPGFTPEAQLAYGLFRDLEVGLRATTALARLDGRYQLLRSEDSGIDLSIGLGGTVHFAPSVGDDVLLVGSFDSSRFDLDVPVLFGWSGDVLQAWFGPRLLWSTWRTDFTFRTGAPVDAVAFAEGTILQVGGQAGLALGYKVFFIALELTVARAIGTAELGLEAVSSVASAGVSRRIDTSGWVVTPALGAMLRF